MGRATLRNQSARRRAIEDGLISAPHPIVRGDVLTPRAGIEGDVVESEVVVDETADYGAPTSVVEVAGLVVEGSAAEVLRFYNAVLRALDETVSTGRRIFVTDPTRVDGLAVAGAWLSRTSPVVLHLADDGTLPEQTIAELRAKQADFLERYSY